MNTENTNARLTLGSLFDGIGGFPYAGSFFGIETLWASEIMPGAISVTMRHLPRMEHAGDITQLHGSELPPVDIITFGSPCQGLSAAGKRKGFSDPRSGLFSEAIRIITEMREATYGQYPTWAVWENVPGALSSNKGLDFRAVLEAFTDAEIPFPRSGRWRNAGMVRGGKAHIAWCVYNAQHFGTAQRRRRIFLVADFGAERSGEILFIPKSLHGYFEAGGTPRQGPAAYAFRGADSAIEILNDQGGDSLSVEKGGHSPTLRSQTHGNLPVVAESVGFDGYNGELTGDKAATLGVNCGMSTGRNGVIDRPNCLTPWDTQQSRVFTDDGASPTLAGADGGGGRNPAGLLFTAGFCAGAGAKANGIGYENECAPTLKGGACGFQMPTVLCAAFMGDSSPSSFGIEYSENASPTLKPRLSGTPCLLAPDILCAATGQPNAEMLENLSATLTCQHEQPIICGAVGVHQNQSGDVNTADTVYSLATNGNATGRNAPLVCTNLHAFSLDSAESNSMKSANPHSGCREVETARTIDTTNPCPSKNQGGIAVVEVHPDISGTLCASGAGLSRPAGMASETVLCVATAQANAEIAEELCPTITEAAGKSGNNKPYIVHPDISGTLCASGAGLSRPAGMASETDLCVVVPSAEAIPIQDKATRCNGGGDTRNNDGAGNGLGVGKEGDPAPTITSGDRHAVAAYCLQGNMIGRADHNGPRGDGVNDDVSFTLNTVDHHAVATFCQQRSDAYREHSIASTQVARQHKDATDLICTAVDCRNFREEGDISGTLQSKGTSPGYSLNCQNPVRLGYIVRRLTPTECERLQGYPDGWTAYTHDGKPISDTARYMMLGNSVAVPCVAYILMGIAAAHRKEA